MSTDTPIPQRRELKQPYPGPNSQALAVRRAKAVAAGVSSTLPVYAARAGGGVIEDVDGNLLIDLGSGIAVTTIGISHPKVVAAVQDEVAKLTHTCFMVTPYEGYIAVAEKLAEVTPGDHEKRSALFNSGAESVENAVKIARLATGRDAILGFDHAYHGRTNLTLALTGKAMPYKKGFGPFAPEIYRAPMSYPFRDPDGMTGKEAAQRVISMAEKSIGADQIAGVLIEPIQGEGGFIVPAEGFLRELADWCSTNGIVFIADEVQSGFARTGAWFACDHEGVVPDLITTAKGIADGMPLAAVTGRAAIMDSVHAGGLGGTYGGNPVACAAALAAIDVMESEGLIARGAHIEELITKALKEARAKQPAIGEIRGRGAMIAVELVVPGSKEPNAALAAAAAKKCHEQGVITLTCGTYGNVIRLLPPLTISDELLTEGLGILTDALINS